MKITLLNTFDIQGGAAIATYRLHRGFRSIGVDSTLLVQAKKSDDRTVKGPRSKWQKLVSFLRLQLDNLIVRLYRERALRIFSPALVPERLASQVNAENPDIAHLFWVNAGFLRLESLRQFQPKIVWTLHDMWPFTGGCHYDDECGKYQQSCGQCPALTSVREKDLSRRIWTRKQKAWDGIPMTVVATSHWLADCARASSLFKNQRIEVIPNGLDTDKYKPLDKSAARTSYGLPQDKCLVLFSAFGATTDRRKGNQYLLTALEKMAKSGWEKKTELVIIGASEPENPPDLGMKVHYIGLLHDEISQVLLYSAADVVVAPSVQENLSNTVLESLACGTPVVAFHIGGMPDLIDHQENGYLAKPFESDDLSAGIIWVLEDKGRHDQLSRKARELAVKRYALKTVAKQYLALYEDILK
jgi:glycosyltransferase involved in cell wall biosynthesis